MGSRLLNGSPQLSVRVTILLIVTVMKSAATLGTTPGTPVIKLLLKLTIVSITPYKICTYVSNLIYIHTYIHIHAGKST